MNVDFIDFDLNCKGTKFRLILKQDFAKFMIDKRINAVLCTNNNGFCTFIMIF
mgnify:CR=1 FL=1